MPEKRQNERVRHAVSRRAAAGGALRVLAVGDVAPGVVPGSALAEVAFAAFDDIGAQTLARLNPDVVVSPLVGTGFDCYDLAERLSEAGFQGRYLAIVDTLPNPSMVRREIAAHFPGLSFELLQTGGKGLK